MAVGTRVTSEINDDSSFKFKLSWNTGVSLGISIPAYINLISYA